MRYAETDQMGYAYHGNYAQYYEVARVEALRSLGMTYRQFEENGIMMPVLKLVCNFTKPARYDDLLTIKTSIKHLPSVRIHFYFEVFNAEQELLNEGEVTLVFVDMKSSKPVRCPSALYDKLLSFF